MRPRIVIIAAMILGVGFAPHGSAGHEALAADGLRAAEARVTEEINESRTNRGLDPLIEDAELSDLASRWSRAMARDGRLRHRTQLASYLEADWTLVGEVVAQRRDPSADAEQLASRIVELFLSSTRHREILHGEVTHVGVGLVLTDSGTMWATANVARASRTRTADLVAGFEDIARSPHRDAIVALSEASITDGCRLGAFCPAAPITRAEFASLLARTLGLPEGESTTTFADVPTSHPHVAAVAATADAGIVGGHVDGSFRPQRPVTRAEVASMLVRSSEELLPSDGPSAFGDVADGQPHRGAIVAIAEAGITDGCSAAAFCPRRHLTRGEAATFLARTHGLL